MRKIMWAAAIAATAAMATPALADTLNAEVRFGDIRGGGRTNSTEISVDYKGDVGSNFVLGAEATGYMRGGRNEATVTGQVGYRLPEVLGIKTLAYGEVGAAFLPGRDSAIWGVGVQAQRQVIGPVSAVVGYRHREAFKSAVRYNEERFNAGLRYSVSNSTDLGVNYFRYTGTRRDDALGVSITQNF